MSQERSSVENVVQTYFDGLYEGNADKLATALPSVPPTCAGWRRAS